MRILLITLILFGCSSSRDQRLLEKSKEVHEAALDVGQQVSKKIEQINDLAEELEEPLKTAAIDSTEVLLADWGSWQSSIVEVPGHDHDHDHHGHDHNHDHGSSPDLTPAMVLEIQQDLQKRALNLDARAQKILNTLTETK